MCHCLLAERAQRTTDSSGVEGQQENGRSTMGLLPFYPVLWSSLLFLWAAQCETEVNSPNTCPEQSEEIYVQNSSNQENYVEKIEEGSFICRFYPTNDLNCSWSFLTLEKDTQLSVDISVCLDDYIIQSTNHTSVERVGSVSMFVNWDEMLNVILHFNMSSHDRWTTYTYMYDMDQLEVLPPPSNISASFENGNLKVTWDLPRSLKTNPKCFVYQLDMGDQETPKDLTIGQQYYTELNANPTRTYSVRIRSRLSESCYGASQWSEWSTPVVVELSVWKLNYLVIMLISFGVPMILLAVLLLVRYQSSSIPCPHLNPRKKSQRWKSNTTGRRLKSQTYQNIRLNVCTAGIFINVLNAC
ncbi:uncharacterized protein LOC114450291 isoform X2 [Parambassis ranga]|uniref:Uncharacterized protein LOC114450291 isoform X2 n=1 Tax=Parambassis ranga TaxID=210632 RepID=A0A6P7K9E1_9TELE|nr:uncharacterized protein LOC114450291 isoform X2 [Parambassis ranga]